MRTQESIEELEELERIMLASSLAEKLCFRVSAFVTWTQQKNFTISQLCEMSRKIHSEALIGEQDYSSKVLIAFVNNLPFEDFN